MAERLVKVKLILDGKEYEAQVRGVSADTKAKLGEVGKHVDSNIRPAIGRLGAAVAMSASQLAALGVSSNAAGRAIGQLATGMSMLVATGFSPVGLAVAGVSAGLGILVGALRDSQEEAKALEEQTKRNQKEFETLTDKTNGIVEALNRFKGIEGTSAEGRAVVDALRQRREIQAQISDLIRQQTALEADEKQESIEYQDITNRINDLLAQRLKLALSINGVSKESTQSAKELLSFLSDPFASLGKKSAWDKEREAASRAAAAERKKAMEDLLSPGEGFKPAYVNPDVLGYEAQAKLHEKWQKKITLQLEIEARKRKRLSGDEAKEIKDQLVITEAERIQAQIEQMNAFAEAAGTAGAMFSEFASIAAEGSALQTALVVGSILMEAAVKSAMQVAEGMAALADPFRAWTAPLHFAAAAAFAAVGAVKGAQAAAGGGGAGGGARAGTGSRQYVPTQTKEKEEPQRYVIAIYGGAYFGRDAEREMAEAVDRYRASQKPGASRGL